MGRDASGEGPAACSLTDRAALADRPDREAFLPVVAPASIEVGLADLHYDSRDELMRALADALAQQYRAIVDAGFLLQLDDAWVPASRDRNPEQRVNAGAYLIEAASSRHEHEFHLRDDVTLPAGKMLIPGVVTHATNAIEHPELVAERITRYADRLGAENIIAGGALRVLLAGPTGLGWAKLGALVEGAALASARF